ncbi:MULTISPECIES: hypothetical protein [Apilactobacillus]|uniref:hypothetical protein n=1 Tax=Apilactobacillus TaxID=2767877 RepID=UPI00220B1B1C|nr:MULTISPECIES: hypothetical protein [Apilactobacillus]MDN2612078.1 hypothetical protein [Apilactobacillus sp. EABW-1NA]WJV43576.1 hypothetical protein QSV47_00825 [Apilactobacillus kunkeei]CAI2560677.1 hypothetical protein AKUH4B103J_02000 [Apilactobacillus kunkeei]CAI2560902.1 hypothetical protein AKUH4B403J_02000 [Apilactobacillus kunkeei]CAI2561550.1 hypothetical protein AKUH4B203M_02000 [Apilactobacillus kunkeei]
MEMDAQKFIDDVTAENFETYSAEVSLADLKKDTAKAFQPLMEFMEEQVNSGRLASALLQVKGEDISFYLQNNIVNLPFRYIKNISKMMSDETNCPLNVYMFVESPDVNRSKMRIDELSSQDDFAVNADLSAKLGAWANDQLAAIEENQKIEQEDAEKTDKKKSAAKKKTTKKTTKKK